MNATQDRPDEDLMNNLDQSLEQMESELQVNTTDLQKLYHYCLRLRAESQTEKAVKYLENLPSHPSLFKAPFSSDAIGVLGFVGLAVLLNQCSEALLAFFKKTGGKAGESIAWADVRLAVPYALMLNREAKADQALDTLEKCIAGGIAPTEALVSDSERISPMVLLLSLYSELGREDELYQFISRMPAYLEPLGLKMEQVFELVFAQDPKLFDQIFDLLKKRHPGT